jgi:catechol 2,3-dioxygenase-like lactoylglutathione lyase family enzyme
VRSTLTSILVDDQDKALRFYTEVLGFVKKTEILLGGHGHLISLLLDGMHSCARRIHRRDRTLPGSRNETRGDAGTHRRGPEEQIAGEPGAALRGSRRAGQRRYPDGMPLPGRPDSEEQDHG